MGNKISSHWPISLTNGAATLFNLFLPLVLVRIISPDDVGRYKVFFLYVMMSPGLFLTGGLSNGLYHWAGKYPESQPEVRQSWTMLLGLVGILSAIGMMLTPLLTSWVHIPQIDLALFFLFCPFGLAGIFLEDLLIARGNIWIGSLYGSGFQVFRALSCVVAAVWSRNVVWVLGAFAASTIVRALVGYWILAKTGDIKPIFSRQKSVNVLHYAFPVSIASLAQTALANVHQLILTLRLLPSQFAFYSMGCLSVPPLQVLEISVNRVLIPKLSKSFAARQPAAAAALFSEAVSELYRFLLPATVGLIVFAEPIIRILFTERYLAAAHYLRFYALFYLSMAVPFDAVARAIGDGKWIMRTALIFMPLSILATWLASARWGAMGALIAFIVIQFAIRIYSVMYEKRHLQSGYTEFLPVKEMLLQAILALGLSLLSLSIRPAFHGDRLWFLVMGPLFTLAYFTVTYTWILKRPAVGEAEPVQVLELVQFLNVGGLERMVYALSNGLNEDDRFSTMVATYDHLEDNAASSLVPQFKEAGIPVLEWRKKKNGFSPKIVTGLLRVTLSERKRILHAHDLGPLIYGSIAKCLSFGRVQLVLTLHTLLHIEHNKRYRLYFKYFFRFADRIIAVSPGIKSGLIALGVDASRIEVVPNGVSFNSQPIGDPTRKRALKRKLLPQAPADLHNARWILCMARLHSIKGQDVALEVWRALPAEARKELALVFVGPSTEPAFARSLAQNIAQVPDADRVVLAGPTHCPEEWLRATDLFFSGSRHEGMPLAPLEAAGSGVPTLLSNIPGHHFLQPWATLFDLARPDDAAHQIVQFLDRLRAENDTTFFERQWNASRPLREKWSETTMIASYMDVFQTLWEDPETESIKNAYAAN